jgi:NADPH:quinone reductase-like Zn-dependent oxidoreductase/NADP-dependent 3-hydroxy acid dehydrogenase YdfG/acyl carrier protein
VRFDGVVRVLLEKGHRAFVEVSSHPVLAMGLTETAEEVLEDPGEAVVTGTLRRDDGGAERFLASLAEMWVHGVEVDWRVAFGGSGARRVALPTYAFQRERYWLQAHADGPGDQAPAGQSSLRHPVLGAAVGLAGGEQWLFTGHLSLQTHPWLADHTVMGVVLLPGAMFVELALRAGRELGCELLRELTLEAPLVLPAEGGVQVQVSVGEPEESGARAVTVFTRSEADDGAADADATQEEWTRHAGGLLARGDGSLNGTVPPERLAALATGAWPPPDAQPLEVDDLYDQLAARGYEYGPFFQGLRRGWQHGDDVFAEVSLPAEQVDQAGRFDLHPALLDAALQSSGLSVLAGRDGGAGGDAPDGDAAGGVRLPFSWSDVHLHAAGAAHLRVALSTAEDGSLSLAMAGEDGALIASVGQLVGRPVSAGQLGGASTHRDSLFRLRWEEPSEAVVPAGAPAEDLAGGLAILGTGSLAVDSAAAGLAARSPGLDRTPAAADAVVYPDLGSLCEALDAGAPVPAAVLADFTSDPPPFGASQSSAEEITAAVRAATHRALELLQGWLRDERLGSSSRLVVVTRDAVATEPGEDVPDLAGAAVWGLVRSAQSENPGTFVLLDIDADEDSARALSAGGLSAGVLVRALGAPAAQEPQMALRGGQLRVPRLARAGGGAGGGLALPEGRRWRLRAAEQGTLEDLLAAPAPELEEPLGEGQVRVELRAAGLNFRDILIALGVYPGEAMLGSEGAGVVLDVGDGVLGLAAGDRVMGLLPGAHGSVAVTDHRLLVPLPAGWSFTRGASVPAAFLTAYYALVDLAGLRQGERLLVHAAAGGVGMAAVQLARHLGAQVFGTASPGKWEVLAAQGLEPAHIATSRTTEFREAFLKTTAGKGLDVVLNALAGEFVDASLELLPRGGRFIEMGKTDIRDPQEIEARCPGVFYQAFDLMEAGPDRIQQMLRELLELFERGALQPLPLRAWDIRRAPQAFRFMSQARHVGKLVLNMPPPPLGSRGTVLVTGGTGGLGSLLARHLVAEHGVRSLVLSSRQGLEADGAQALQDELTGLGAEVIVAACDVAEREQVAQLLARVPAEHPLSAVVHTAGALDDGVVEALTPQRIDPVLAPKVDGAWHLHELTEHMDLSAFVLFSSVAATFGGAGQGNYAAGNAFMDALASYRQARGLAGASLAWGLWAKSSSMTSHLREQDRSRIARLGLLPLSAEEGLGLLDAAGRSDEALLVTARVDTAGLRAQARAGLVPALLRGLIALPSRSSDAGGAGGSLASRLAGLPESEHERVVLDLVRTQAAAVLGHASAQAIHPQQAFKDVGFDSLAAVELRNRLSAATGLRLPATLVFDHPNPVALAEYLREQVSHDGAPTVRSLTTELDKLETMLSAVAVDEVERTGIATRLQALLVNLGGPEVNGSTAHGDEAGADEDLQSASDEEMFELIDRELGA